MMTTTLDRSSIEAFESVYADAHGNTDLVPWSDGRPSPALVNWLNAMAPSIVRCGARIVVVGCGLGEDAREICRRGYDVTAFDCSPTAIEWARSIDSNSGVSYCVADLFDLPPKWRHRFDLVVEINTIQALPIDKRDAVVSRVAELVSPRGCLLVIARHAETSADQTDGPPWPITLDELNAATRAAGLEPQGDVSVFVDGETPPVRRMRGLFRRVP